MYRTDDMIENKIFLLIQDFYYQSSNQVKDCQPQIEDNKIVL